MGTFNVAKKLLKCFDCLESQLLVHPFKFALILQLNVHTMLSVCLFSAINAFIITHGSDIFFGILDRLNKIIDVSSSVILFLAS